MTQRDTALVRETLKPKVISPNGAARSDDVMPISWSSPESEASQLSRF